MLDLVLIKIGDHLKNALSLISMTSDLIDLPYIDFTTAKIDIFYWGFFIPTTILPQ